MKRINWHSINIWTYFDHHRGEKSNATPNSYGVGDSLYVYYSGRTTVAGWMDGWVDIWQVK